MFRRELLALPEDVELELREDDAGEADATQLEASVADMAATVAPGDAYANGRENRQGNRARLCPGRAPPWRAAAEVS